MSAKMAVLSKNAQWFEDNSPLFPEHKKKNVVGVSYKTVNVAGEEREMRHQRLQLGLIFLTQTGFVLR